ncbi:MAG: hypothetical protein P8Y27_05035 [Chromatiaceae bacterium]
MDDRFADIDPMEVGALFGKKARRRRKARRARRKVRRTARRQRRRTRRAERRASGKPRGLRRFVQKLKKSPILRGVAKAAKSIITSPVLGPLAAAGGIAVAVKAGADPSAALHGANRVLDALRSKSGKERLAGKAIIRATVKAAAKGDPDAIRGAKVLAIAKRATRMKRALAKTKKTRALKKQVSRELQIRGTKGHLVTPSGRILSGQFRKAT